MAAFQASLLLCKLPLSPKRFSPFCARDRPFRASDLRHSNFRRSSSRVASVPCAIRPENNLSSDSGKESSSGSGGSEDRELGGGNEVVPEKKSSGNSTAEKVAMRRIPAVALVMRVLAAILSACRMVFSWFKQLWWFFFALEPHYSRDDTKFEYDSKGYIIGIKVKSPENAKTFKDVKGCNEAKQELEEIVEFLKNPGKFTRLGGKLPKGILLKGAPGTGKTLLAKAIAGEAGVPFLYRSGSEFDDMYVGVGPERVRSLFEEAREKAPCIIFIDEIDAVGSDRRNSENQTLKESLNQLLVEMDGFRPNEGIILLAATNMPEILDPALKRAGRFDRHIVVPVPDVKGRQEILELYMQDKPLGDDIDVKSLARETSKFTGADLENLVNIAAIRAAVEGADKISAAHMEFAKDRILMGTARKTILSEETKKIIAYHESGHAIVALNIEGAPPIHKVTIVPHGSSLGMVSHIPNDDEKSVSNKKQLLAYIDVCMGGRAAEELIFGKDHITSGASSDLKNATKLARSMVSRYGMSDIIGPVHVTDRPSSEMLLHIDAEAGKILRESYDRAQVLIKKHEKALHALANALLERETLTEKEIKQALLPNTGGQVPKQRDEPVQQQGGGDLVPA